MARNTGPTQKISRRFGIPLFGPSKALERKAYPPGMHGAKGTRKKNSEYSVALGEKQKLRFQYGVLEKQFRRFFREAVQERGVTGEILLRKLECRLDNVTFRLGFGNSRRAARQLVNHGHVTVNGRKVDIASFQVKAGDIVSVKDTAKARQLVLRSLELTQITPVPDWLIVNKENFTGTVVRLPIRDDINPVVNEQLIVELYSR